MSSDESSDGGVNGHNVGDDEVKATVEASDHSLNGPDVLDDEDGDLFGSEDEDVPVKPARQRKLDDEELDSGDDLERNDRDPFEDEDQDIEYDAKPERIITYDANLQRVHDPEVTDNELYFVNMPPFLGIETENFDPAAYLPPDQGHAGQKESQFSPFSAAATSLFWRHDPTNTERLQSSSRIIRWSDGSLTLQLASSPRDQYKISATTLRQVPQNPKKPLPIHANRQAKASRDYDPNKDAHVYLAAAHASDSMYRIVSPVTASLKILPTGEQNDDSMMRLQSSLAAAASTDDPVSSIREVKEDPELAKKRAELAEKEKMRAQRRRENMEQKEFDRKKRVFGRGARGAGVGLTVGDLEEDEIDDMRETRPKKKPKRRPNRRGEIYSDDEDEGYSRGRTREDEYDEDDGFLVGSDEEPEMVEVSEEEAEAEEEDPDVDDLEIEGRQTVLQGRSRAGAPQERAGTPPRRDMDVDEPARNSPQARKRGKRVVDDDDEDE